MDESKLSRRFIARVFEVSYVEIRKLSAYSPDFNSIQPRFSMHRGHSAFAGRAHRRNLHDGLLKAIGIIKSVQCARLFQTHRLLVHIRMQSATGKQRMRVAWLAPYHTASLLPEMEVNRPLGRSHPCSWIVNLSDALAKRGDVELHLITESSRVARDQSIEKFGIHFHVLKSSLPIVNRGWPGWIPGDALSGFALEKQRMIRAIRRIRPDVVHAHGTEAAYGAAGVRCGLPCVISIQGIITEYSRYEPLLRYRLVSRHELDQVRRCRFFTCRTHWDTGFVKRVNPEARIFHIEEAMSPVFFAGEWQAADEPTVLYVGGLEERKGVHFLLEAIALVKMAIPNVKLTVVGGGDDALRRRCDQLCESLGITKNVTFAGIKSATEIAALHRIHQVFVLASRIENSPNTVAEAMVTGMPVIATNVGGLASMIEDGSTGWLVEYGSVNGLAERIAHLLKNRSERERLGAAARKVGREKHWPETVAEKTVSAYHEIVQAAGR